MSGSAFPFLSVLIILPVLGSLVVPFMSRNRAGQIKGWALLVSLVTLAVAGAMLSAFRSGTADMQFVEQAPWFPGLGISYHLGVDGISLLLVVLTALLTPVALGASWREMESRPKEYAVFLLLL